MRKPGKPNTFLKGLQMDMDPLLQPKESYRYAKNVRLASYVGKNISVQPYDSDKLALHLTTSDITTATVNSISNILSWGAVDDTVYEEFSNLTWQSFFNYLSNQSVGINFQQFLNEQTLSDNYIYDGNTDNIDEIIEYTIFQELLDLYENEGGFQEGFEYADVNFPPFVPGGIFASWYNYLTTEYNAPGNNLPVTVAITGIGDENADNIGLTFTITLNLSNDDTETLQVSVPPFSEISDVTQDPLFLENIIANAITSQNNGYTVSVSQINNQVGWAFVSTNENTVESFSINATGEFIITNNFDENSVFNQIAESWNEATNNEYSVGNLYERIKMMGSYFEAKLDNYLSSIDNINDTITIEDFTVLGVTETENAAQQDSEDITISKGMQILGHYAFSDYLVLLGRWEAHESITGYPSDFVLKTSQKEDGTLSGPDEPGVYELFFLGNLGFSNKKKLKVTGSEENENIRRIYFTDGDIPVRTMNVGADSSIYSQYTDDPGFFDLFVETKVSVPKVTGFVDGGVLESIGHAYAFRYKTLDGRMSRISPVSNPASLPLSSSALEAPFTKGGDPGQNTAKSIKGVIEDVDTRYPFVELIHIPYIGGAPGVAQVFATYPVPNDTTVINWIHTGNEIVREEIIALEFGADYISWDSCEALEVKDNRLFCGNLKGVTESIPTDFSLASYNSFNQRHAYETGNPDLFDDLLYSQGGLRYEDGEAVYHPPQPEDFGKYTKPNGYDPFRYIKGPEESEGVQNGLYTSTLSAPEYWTAANVAPTPYEVKRGIFGAESEHFRTPLPGTEDNPQYEGVRVTFRVLGAESGDAPAVQLDSTNKLITTGNSIGARAPFYSVDKNQDAGGYYANYANPLYNSNYVGYRRGEIYRFGLLFYDKKGSPMFVKRLGDLRMPEHSTEYINPSFTGSTVGGFDMKWPYYFQTSRHQHDGGFVDWPSKTWDDENYIKPYSQNDKGEGQLGCVLYPYFEVKLSAETCQKISGYSIVRVERTPDNRTISTSGILQRAVKYADDDPDSIWNSPKQYDSGGTDEQGDQDITQSNAGDMWKGANRAGMAGKFGNYHNSIFTPTVQDYRSHIYGNSASAYTNSDSKNFYTVGRFQGEFGATTPLIGGNKHWSHSNIFTLDSPDAVINTDFNLNFAQGDRIKITESRYCVKEPIHNGDFNNNVFGHFFNHYLSDGFYGGQVGHDRPDIYLGPHYVSLFACQIDPELLKGEDIEYYQPSSTTTEGGTTVQNFGGWLHKLSKRDKYSTDWEVDWKTFTFMTRRASGYDLTTYDAVGGSSTFWQDNDLPSIHNNFEGDVNLGIYTKYYSKRIGAYPMYGMARPDWNYFEYGELHGPRNADTAGAGGLGDAGGQGFGMNTRDYKHNGINRYLYPCFTAGAAWKADPSNPYVNQHTDSTNLSQLSLDGDEQYLESDWLFAGEYEEMGGARATNVCPDIIANAGLEGSTNAFGERLDMYSGIGSLNPYWNENNIFFAQIVNPGQEVAATVLGSDRPYRNATMWHDPHAQNRRFSLNSFSLNERNFQLGGNVGDSANGSGDEGKNLYSESRSDFSLGHRTIVMSLPNHAMLPITRHCLQANNWRERVYYQFGGCNLAGYKTHDEDSTPGDFEGYNSDNLNWTSGAQIDNPTNFGANSGASGSGPMGRTGGGAKWSVDSPEVTMASIVKKHSANTLYGGNTTIAYSKNTFVSTGCFRQVNQTEAYDGSGNNGLAVFGGDTFIANFSLKKVHNPDTDAEYSDRGVLTAYTCPVETETNLDLRHGYFFGGDTQSIVKQIPDDTGNYAYNTSYDAENKIQIFSPKPFGFIEVDHWPSTIAFSDPKMSGDTTDNYSVFPVNQIKDLDYTKGPITQMFNLRNTLFALQDSGTCQLSVNPRIMIPSGGGGAIQAVTGTDSVIERFDYVSPTLGSQHFHGSVITDRAAYYYDDTASKFLQLTVGQGGGFVVNSLGDSLGMQTFFQQYNNSIINDEPLKSPNIYSTDSTPDGAYSLSNDNYDALEGWGGINIGYDPEYGEVLLSISNENPYTLVYSEKMNAFTSFLSKRPSSYIRFKNRMYCTYDSVNEDDGYLSNTALFLANGHIYDSATEGSQKYLNFGNVDYYIMGHGSDGPGELTEYTTYSEEDYPSYDLELNNWGTRSSLNSKEPMQIHFVLNDEAMQPKIFDNLDILINAHTDTGANHLYFRKFTFWGNANRNSFSEYDASEFTGTGQIYSNSANGFFNDPGQKMWYSVKDGTHHVPVRESGYGVTDSQSPEGACRGTYAIVAAVVGWDEGERFFDLDDVNIKSEGFSILSLIPYYRYSRR